ncbi:MAG: metal ABC transporter substrate-binding protein [Phycisphaerales bacterium]
MVHSWVRTALVGAFLGVFFAALAGCGSGREPGPMRVVVSIAPLESVVRGVAPEGAVVETIIPASASPHGFQPKPSDVRALERADLIVVVGLGMEGGLTRYVRDLEHRGTRVVEFAGVVGIEGHDHHGHDHSHDGDDDPHLWLDAAMMLELVDALESEMIPAMRGTDSGSDDAVLATPVRADGQRALIRAADAEARAALEPFAGARIVTHHGAFGRFCARYGVEVAAVLRPVEGAEPSPGELAAVRDAIAAGGVRGAFTEPQFDGRELRAIAERAGIPVGSLDPLGGSTWMEMMRANTDEITRVLGGG